jgi:hypothetical protein
MSESASTRVAWPSSSVPTVSGYTGAGRCALPIWPLGHIPVRGPCARSAVILGARRFDPCDTHGSRSRGTVLDAGGPAGDRHASASGRS